jgi:hypothetical protein
MDAVKQSELGIQCVCEHYCLVSNQNFADVFISYGLYSELIVMHVKVEFNSRISVENCRTRG